MMNDYHNQQLQGMALQMARATNRILVHVSYIPRLKVERYQERKIKIGHEVYYLLHYTELPTRARIQWEVGSVIIPKNK